MPDLVQRKPIAHFRGIEAFSLGLDVDAVKTLSFEDYCELGRRIGGQTNAITWWIADWVFAGDETYGDKYTEALAVTGLDYGYLANLAYVSGRFTISRRHENLTFGHHAEVAALPEHEQEDWLNMAQRKGWSVKKLREELREAKSFSERKPDSVAKTILRLEADPGDDELWQAAAERRGLDIKEWAKQGLRKLAQEELADDRRAA